MIAEFGAAKITFPVTIVYRAQSLSRSIVVYTQINEFCNVLQVTVSHMKGRLMHPRIVQGGMGIGVSGWHLARKVSLAGELGTVSGAGIWLVMARRLQDGDQGGHYRRALAEFPDQAMAQSILKRYFLPDGRQGKKYREVPIMRLRLKNGSQQGPLSEHLENLMVTAGFAEVWLAKEGQPGVVAINLLEKIQLSLLPILYGAMIASVDYVLIGAGLPAQIPEALDLLAQHRPARTVEPDRFRADVSVYQTGAVNRRQSIGQRTEHRERLRCRQPPAALQQVTQATSRRARRHQSDPAVFLRDIQHWQQMRVIDGARELHHPFHDLGRHSR